MEKDIMTGVNKVEELLNKAREWGVFRQIKKIPDMLLHPRLFWRDYDSMLIKDKLIQFVTYGTLFALIIWLAAPERLSVGELAKIVTMEIFSLFLYVIILSLANMIIKREWKDLGFFVVFCCYTKFIFIIPQILALKGYVMTETPLLMGVAVLIPVLVELMMLIYPAFVWQNTSRKVVEAILLSILFLNVYDAFFVITELPHPHTSNYDNAIIKERFDLGKSIKNAYDIPTYVVSWEQYDNEWFLYSNPADTLASKKYEDTEKFFAVLEEDIDSLRVISGRCRFNSNKAFFDQMYSLKRAILYVYRTKAYRDSPIFKQTDVMVDSVIVNRIYYREFSKELKRRNDELAVQDIRDSEQFSKVTSISLLGALWHPVWFISSLYPSKN